MKREANILFDIIDLSVSDLQYIVKVMESIVKTNILHPIEHLNSNNLLSSCQFGFLRGHSCTTQLLYVMHALLKIKCITITLGEFPQ